ncbi:GIY-YIG nuclease family protein [Neobacillus drentensis]|uniref:GIY-YIG nuclease family protein n=1 Tax=Neobacillus drentensis TaxID=220684 RepID=UPI0030011594
MDKNRRKELKEEYKQIKTYMGVYQIINTINGKIYVDSCLNLKNKWLTLRGQLDMGRFANFELQRDWKELGEGAFVYEVLEEKEIDEATDKRWELKQLEKPWLKNLQPYGVRGYNKLPKD